MRLHQKRSSRTLRALPALLLALLLCACSGNTPNMTGPAATLPVIGIGELDADAATKPDNTEATTESESAETETDTEPESTEAPASSEAESTEEPTSATEEETEPETEPEPETTPEETKAPSTGLRVWIGDARFSAIHDTVSYNKSRDYFISGWGVAYYWMINTAVPAFDALAAQKQIDVVYWSLGASDITEQVSDKNYQSAEKYAAELNKLIEKYPDTKFYVLSYGPVGGNGIKPSDVKDAKTYNATLRSFTYYVLTHTNTSYIDVGAYLESSGYTVKSDGRQYEAETNKRIYQYVLSQSEQ